MEYIPTIGLEIHAELKTATKMFCGSPNISENTTPNTAVCPVCLAHPGTLPVINREAVRHVLRVGAAIGGSLAQYTEFDRKNYFYPDLPKGYQISQYAYPLVSGGTLCGVEVTRIHLEEDTARSQHIAGSDKTLIDFNRAGVPLMEMVTEPTIHSAELAGKFARELQLVLRYLGASSANMERGEMRVEANISVAPPEGQLGTKVEVKNLNSFRSMERAIEYEVARQIALLEKGEAVVQETRGWDEGRQETFAQRIKEGSADYRYFPDPDLPKIVRSDIADLKDMVLKESLPELPTARRMRYEALGLKREDAEAFTFDVRYGNFFDSVCAAVEGGGQKAILLAANYIASDLVKIIRDIESRDNIHIEILPVKDTSFARLMGCILDGTLTSRGAKDVLLAMVETGKEPDVLVKELGVAQESDPGALRAIAERIVAAHEEQAAQVRSGNEKALQFFVGQGMKETKGAANPEVLLAVFREILKP